MEERNETIRQLIILEHYDEARENLIGLFEKDSRNAEVCFLLGKCFLRTGDISNAVRFYRRSVELQPESREFFLALGSAYELFGEKIKAMDAYRKVLELSPDFLFAGERFMALLRVSSRE